MLRLADERTPVGGGFDFLRSLLAALLPPHRDVHEEPDIDDVDHDDDDVAKGFVGDVEGEAAAIGLGLQNSAGPEEWLVFTPAEVLVGMVDPLVGNDAESEKENEEDVGGADHCFAPRQWPTGRTALSIRNHRERQTCGQEKRKEKRLVHTRPLEYVDCQHYAKVPFRGEAGSPETSRRTLVIAYPTSPISSLFSFARTLVSVLVTFDLNGDADITRGIRAIDSISAPAEVYRGIS